jgi:hypothetical protein
MSERVLRLVAGGGMLATLFLRLNPLGSEGFPNWTYLLWFSSEALPAIFGDLSILERAIWLGLMLSLLAVPLLILFNAYLFIHPSRKTKMLYRVLVLILLPLTWYRSFHIDFEWPEAGVYWVSTVAVSVATLIEIILVVRERLTGQENAGQQEDPTLSG